MSNRTDTLFLLPLRRNKIKLEKTNILLLSASGSLKQQTMASVPSIGCLLAKNQYYRKSSISLVSSLTSSDSVNLIDDDRPLQGLPEMAESTWWFKSFFHSESGLSNVRNKDLSSSGTHS
ncbi:Hypothetical predicted protein [Marmota monax]|uniref:Pancreatic progenitor cell differentiation and proliferation factor-like protein n=1 Tax=Marmota monax TaxID=9995 RepID=A0A5E4BT96_MARMO|nr:Hypothetical predicted protein [Marmota monax]